MEDFSKYGAFVWRGIAAVFRNSDALLRPETEIPKLKPCPEALREPKRFS